MMLGSIVLGMVFSTPINNLPAVPPLDSPQVLLEVELPLDRIYPLRYSPFPSHTFLLMISPSQRIMELYMVNKKNPTALICFSPAGESVMIIIFL